MSGITLTEVDDATIPTPPAGKQTVFVDDTLGPARKDDTGTVTSLTGAAGPSSFPLEPIAHGNMGATETFDFGAGPVVAGVSGPFHTATMDANTTITLTTSTTTDQAVLEIWLIGDGTPRTLTWDPDVTWEGGSPPTLDYTLGTINRLFFESIDGTEWFGTGPGGTVTRASLGLDTTDSPQFAGLNIGAATDTTITRTGAGDIAVEGNAIYRAGGTDVPITDGGTGASTKAAAFDALSPMTTAGDIIIGGASGTGTRLAAGSTSGHVLTSNGSGAAPSWQAGGGGGGGLAQSYTGNTTAGGTAEVWTTAATTVYVMPITLGAASTFLSVAAYIRMNTLGGSSAMVGLWNDSAGSPTTLIAANGIGPASAAFVGHQSAAAGWYDVPLSAHVAAGNYWIGFGLNGQGTLWSIFYDAGAGGKITLSNNGMLADATYQGSFASGARSYSVRASILA